MPRVIQIYGRRKCRTTRKAERFFSDRRIQVQSIDLDRHTPGRREIELFFEVVGDDVMDTDGAAYRKRGLAYMDFDPVDELEQHPELMRTPVVRSGREVVVGDDAAGWKRLAEQPS